MTTEEEAQLVNKYGRDIVDLGYGDFQEYINKRKKAFDDLTNEKIKQDINYAQYNKDFKDNKKWPYDEHLKSHNAKWDAEEITIAENHGYMPPEKDKETLKKEAFAEFKKQFDGLEKGLNKDNPLKETFEDFKKNFEKGDDLKKKIDDLRKEKSEAEKSASKQDGEPSKKEKDFAAFKENLKSVTGRNPTIEDS
ncbi:hypothetical protein ACFQZS_10760 [Mucilaginibacter calamicampi]|uniref:Uncharacterized protein n=1 Tax=Mucilaginibacter calamicampi TaxID=1302352 RepID=A0ABW2YVZ0_9SPHI